MGVVRSTVLIGPDGAIEQIWTPVDPDAHLDIIRDALA
jgi:peroxiredoxin